MRFHGFDDFPASNHFVMDAFELGCDIRQISGVDCGGMRRPFAQRLDFARGVRADHAKYSLAAMVSASATICAASAREANGRSAHAWRTCTRHAVPSKPMETDRKRTPL